MQVKDGENEFPVCAHIGRANSYVSEKKLNSNLSDLKSLIADLAAIWAGMNSFEISADEPSLFLGMGAPEGNVAAPPGSIYLDLEAMGRKKPKH